MRLFYLFLMSSLCLLTCEPEPLPTPMIPEEPPVQIPVDTFSYLALGDSYTIGEGVSDTERYPTQLGDSLLRRGIKLSPFDIVARTGWTTTDLDNGISTRTGLQDRYDLITLLIGVNNFYRGRTLTEYELEFTELLNRAISFADEDRTRVCVLSIPDFAFTPFGGGDPLTSQGIDTFNASNRRITDSLGVTYVDVTTISRDGLNEPALVSNDMLHPSGLQYSRWVGVLAPIVMEMLEE